MTTFYRDVSHYDGAYKPTGPTAAKCTEGATFTDPQFAGIRARAKAAGFPFLPYHFLAHINIAGQVAHVIATIGTGVNVMLDVESETGKPDPTLADVIAFADLYAAKADGGRVILGYIPEWFWSGHWKQPSLAALSARHIGLVSSNYTTYSDTGPGWKPYGGVAPIIWQYTSTGGDHNAFRGTLAQLAAVFAGETSTPTTEEDMPTADELVAAFMDYELPDGQTMKAYFQANDARTSTAVNTQAPKIQDALDAIVVNTTPAPPAPSPAMPLDPSA